MTPKEKALELHEKYLTPNAVNILHNVLSYREAKYCALITVDEILKSFEGFMDSSKNFRNELEIDAGRYWLKVKEEILKL